jgi:hypothetical protein
MNKEEGKPNMNAEQWRELFASEEGAMAATAVGLTWEVAKAVPADVASRFESICERLRILGLRAHAENTVKVCLKAMAVIAAVLMVLVR